METETAYWFARQMLRKLEEHSYKRGWEYLTIGMCTKRIGQELSELRSAAKKSKPDYQAIIDEAADVGNFAMFAANAARQLQAAEKLQLDR